MRPLVCKGTIRFALLGFALLLVSGLLGACRELATPTEENPEMILARGVVVRSNGAPVNGARVSFYFRGDEEEDSSYFSRYVITGSDGSFESWIPNQALRVSIDPSGDLPGLTEWDFRFTAGEVTRFVLEGILVRGEIHPFDHPEELTGSNINFYTHVRRLNGDEERVETNTIVNDEGGFEIYIPQPGRYAVSWRSCCDVDLHYAWPDSVLAEPNQTVSLLSPMVSFEMELLLGGAPLPSGGRGNLQVRTKIQGDWRSEIAFPVQGNGQTRRFSLIGLRSANALWISPQSDPQVVVPQLLAIFPLAGGESMARELGLYALTVWVVDGEGLPLPSVWVWLAGETTSNAAHQDTNLDGQCLFRVNAGDYRIHIEEDGYYGFYRNLEISGDGEIELVLKRVLSASGDSIR